MIEFKHIQNNIIEFNNDKSIFNKKILIVTGQHGNEQSPLKLILDLINLIKSNQSIIQWDIFSKITIINGANIEALEQNSRQVNRSFDFNRQYNSSNQITTDPDYIKSIIDQYDLIIDVHSSEYLMHPIVALDNNSIYTNDLIRFCDKFNILYMICDSSNDNTLKQYCLNKNNKNTKDKIGFISSSSNHIKVAFTLEINGVGEIIEDQQNIEILLKIINNIKNFYFTLDKQLCRSNIDFICSTYDGIFIRNEHIENDGIIGSIYSLTGDCLEQIKMNCDDTILQLRSSQYVKCGQWIAVIKSI